MSSLITIAIKDLRLLMRDRMNAFFTFVFPLLIAILFANIFGGQRSDLAIAVVNEDGGKAATAFVADLKSAGGLKLHEVATRQEAETLVRSEKAIASVIIPAGFEQASDRVLAGDSMKIEGVVDPARDAESGLLIGKLNEIGYKQMVRSFGESDRMTKMLDEAQKSISVAKDVSPVRKLLLSTMFGAVRAVSKDGTLGGTPAGGQSSGGGATGSGAETGFSFQPITIDLQPLATRATGPSKMSDVSFPQGILWGLMGCVTAFAASIASERTSGTLMRLRVSPLSPSSVLLGKALACLVACLLVQALLVAVGVIFFGLYVRDWAVLALAMSLAALGFVGVMMAMAGMATTEGGAAGIGRGVILMLALIGGGSIPVFLMPEWMQTVSSISPFKWAGQTIQMAIWRGQGVSDLLLPGGVLIAIAIAGFFVGLVGFRRGLRN